MAINDHLKGEEMQSLVEKTEEFNTYRSVLEEVKGWSEQPVVTFDIEMPHSKVCLVGRVLPFPIILLYYP